VSTQTEKLPIQKYHKPISVGIFIKLAGIPVRLFCVHCRIYPKEQSEGKIKKSHEIRSKAFTAIKFNETFWDLQLRQVVEQRVK
jgi:hypothetical protein